MWKSFLLQPCRHHEYGKCSHGRGRSLSLVLLLVFETEISTWWKLYSKISEMPSLPCAHVTLIPLWHLSFLFLTSRFSFLGDDVCTDCKPCGVVGVSLWEWFHFGFWWIYLMRINQLAFFRATVAAPRCRGRCITLLWDYVPLLHLVLNSLLLHQRHFSSSQPDDLGSVFFFFFFGFSYSSVQRCSRLPRCIIICQTYFSSIGIIQSLI